MKKSKSHFKNLEMNQQTDAIPSKANMDPIRPPSLGDLGDHFVDIHEVVLPEAGPGPGPSTSDATVNNDRSIDKRVSRSIRSRVFPPPRVHHQPEHQQRGFNRQVSLATGFSVINGESRSRRERRVLARGGISFGGFSSVVEEEGGGGGGQKGDFRLFRTKTKPIVNKQMSLMPTRKDRETDNSDGLDNSAAMEDSVLKAVPAVRYFAALKGPELDEVKESEDILLPKDETWPFLLRFPINSFGICLGLSSQSVLWQALATSPATKFLHISHDINLSLWLLAVFVHLSVSTTYLLKCIYYFEAVRREYYHPVRVNFFFAPWVVFMFLAIGTPRAIEPDPLHPSLWCIFMAPYFLLELKIYGQWLSGGKRRLCKVANPSSHLSVVGNFVGAILADRVGWKEAGKFFWAVGLAHYLVVFVTLYQRLPTSEALPKELHPVYSMFIAAPSAASISWAAIYGEFDGLARTCYFIALFLYISLVIRINFFTGFQFSVAWWAYTFPMTTVSVATIKYVEEVPSVLSKGLVVALSAVSTTMVAFLLVLTFLHAFVWRTLFPNDLAIAITKKKQCPSTKKSASKRYNAPPVTRQSPFLSSTQSQTEPLGR